MAARGIKWIIRRSDYGIRAATSHLRRNPRFITQRSEGQLVYSRPTVSIPLSLSPIRFLARVAVPRVCTRRALSSISYYKPTTYPGRGRIEGTEGMKCNRMVFHAGSLLLGEKKKRKKNEKRIGIEIGKFSLSLTQFADIPRLIAIIISRYSS